MMLKSKPAKSINIFKFLLLLVVAIVISACAQQPVLKTVKIGDAIIKAEIADTPELWYKGLSNRKKLCENCGMLFIFGDKQERTFVMRNMNFPLDIIWITGDEVVKINKNLPPEGSSPVKRYSSGAAVDYVLEVNGGFSVKGGARIGNKIKIFD